MILTGPQIKTLQKAIAVANDVLPQLEFLERVAVDYPPMRDAAQVARAEREMLARLGESALEADRILSQG